MLEKENKDSRTMKEKHNRSIVMYTSSFFSLYYYYSTTPYTMSIFTHVKINNITHDFIFINNLRIFRTKLYQNATYSFKQKKEYN